tara:strand:+ start:11 stop:502 length:492 start_codon:yes stop_codon:yes gene_type:complete
MHRILKHLFTTARALRRTFPPAVLDQVEAAIANSETRHGGEIQFAIESSLGLKALLGGVTAREQAVRAFADLKVWDTEQNSGVLVYVLLSEQRIEIVADRGYAGRVSDQQWQIVCADMQRAFAEGRFANGAIEAVEAISTLVEAHFPGTPDDVDERPNRPVLL